MDVKTLKIQPPAGYSSWMELVEAYPDIIWVDNPNKKLIFNNPYNLSPIETTPFQVIQQVVKEQQEELFSREELKELMYLLRVAISHHFANNREYQIDRLQKKIFNILKK